MKNISTDCTLDYKSQSGFSMIYPHFKHLHVMPFLSIHIFTLSGIVRRKHLIVLLDGYETNK